MNLRISSLHFEIQHFKISVTGGHMLYNRAVPAVFVETAQKVIQKLMIIIKFIHFELITKLIVFFFQQNGDAELPTARTLQELI